jgi:CMP-N,N'-diacetyllegionaminic acid synthase
LNVVALIPARGGSKGIPRKNVLPVAGKPLIAWTIAAALRSRKLSRILVSTDDAEIAQVAREYGAEAPFLRPPELARDESPVIDTVEHALRWVERAAGNLPDYVLLLQPTSPLRTTEDIDGAIDFAYARGAEAVLGVCEASPHPYLARRIAQDGSLDDFIVVPTRPARRQDFPPAYVLNGAIYLNRVESLLASRTFQPPGTLAYPMPAERSCDIDTPLDLQIAEMILKNERH